MTRPYRRIGQAEPVLTNAVNSPHSAYAAGAYVGKSCAQVGKARDDSIVANDVEVFDKWSQALASADDLANDATEEGEQKNDAFLSLILPILVVPDGRLCSGRPITNQMARAKLIPFKQIGLASS